MKPLESGGLKKRRTFPDTSNKQCDREIAGREHRGQEAETFREHLKSVDSGSPAIKMPGPSGKSYFKVVTKLDASYFSHQTFQLPAAPKRVIIPISTSENVQHRKVERQL